LQEIFFIEIVGNLAIDEILEFVRAAQIIYRDDILFATLVECLDDVRPDKSGAPVTM
jgi:hypothetical protein